MGLPPVVEPPVNALRRLSNFDSQFNPNFKEITNRARLYYGDRGVDEPWPCPLCRTDLLQHKTYSGFGEVAPLSVNTRIETNTTSQIEKVLTLLDKMYELTAELENIEKTWAVRVVTSEGINGKALLAKPGYQAFVRNYVGKLMNLTIAFAEANGRGNEEFTLEITV